MYHQREVIDVEPSTSNPVMSTDSNIALTNIASTETSFNDDLSLDEQIRFAEAMWSAMVAEHDVSFIMSDHATKMFHKMFPDSPIAAGFKCSRTKTNYTIVDGIAIDLQEKLIESLQNVPFSILIDESNKQYGIKFLVIMIKFYDEQHNDVTTRFLDICVCNKGTSDAITKIIVDYLNKNNLSFDNLIQIMTDNPNVMRGVLTGVVTQLKSKYADHLIDIGGCSLHHVSSFFTFHVEFCEKFSHIQEIFDLKKHRIL